MTAEVQTGSQSLLGLAQERLLERRGQGLSADSLNSSVPFSGVKRERLLGKMALSRFCLS